MDNLIKGKQSLLYHFPDDAEGMVRDYCFVGDVVKANLAALTKGMGDFFNIGTGKETKTLELYNVIFKVFKGLRPDVPDSLSVPVRKAARPGDLTLSCLVAEKARTSLGWTPETHLQKGIEKTLQWRLKQPG